MEAGAQPAMESASPSTQKQGLPEVTTQPQPVSDHSSQGLVSPQASSSLPQGLEGGGSVQTLTNSLSLKDSAGVACPASHKDGSGVACPVSHKTGSGVACPASHKDSAGVACLVSHKDSAGVACPVSRKDISGVACPDSHKDSAEVACPASHKDSAGVACPASHKDSAGVACLVSHKDGSGVACPVSHKDSAGVACPASHKDSVGVACPASHKDSAGVACPASHKDSAEDACPASHKDSAGVACPASHKDSAGVACPASHKDSAGVACPASNIGAACPEPRGQLECYNPLQHNGSPPQECDGCRPKQLECDKHSQPDCEAPRLPEYGGSEPAVQLEGQEGSVRCQDGGVEGQDGGEESQSGAVPLRSTIVTRARSRMNKVTSSPITSDLSDSNPEPNDSEHTITATTSDNSSTRGASRRVTRSVSRNKGWAVEGEEEGGGGRRLGKGGGRRRGRPQEEKREKRHLGVRQAAKSRTQSKTHLLSKLPVPKKTAGRRMQQRRRRGLLDSVQTSESSESESEGPRRNVSRRSRHQREGLKRKSLPSESEDYQPPPKKRCQEVTSDPSPPSPARNILADILTDIPEVDINPITLSEANKALLKSYPPNSTSLSPRRARKQPERLTAAGNNARSTTPHNSVKTDPRRKSTPHRQAEKQRTSPRLYAASVTSEDQGSRSSCSPLFSSASHESTTRLLQVCHALASELKPKLDFVMECTNSELDSKLGVGVGTETVTMCHSGYASETDSNNSGRELGANPNSNLKSASEPNPDTISGVPSSSHSEDVGQKCRRKIPEYQSTHFKSLRKWEEDLRKGSKAEHGPVLYAMEKMQEKLREESPWMVKAKAIWTIWRHKVPEEERRHYTERAKSNRAKYGVGKKQLERSPSPKPASKCATAVPSIDTAAFNTPAATFSGRTLATPMPPMAGAGSDLSSRSQSLSPSFVSPHSRFHFGAGARSSFVKPSGRDLRMPRSCKSLSPPFLPDKFSSLRSDKTFAHFDVNTTPSLSSQNFASVNTTSSTTPMLSGDQNRYRNQSQSSALPNASSVVTPGMSATGTTGDTTRSRSLSPSYLPPSSRVLSKKLNGSDSRERSLNVRDVTSCRAKDTTMMNLMSEKPSDICRTINPWYRPTSSQVGSFYSSSLKKSHQHENTPSAAIAGSLTVCPPSKERGGQLPQTAAYHSSARNSRRKDNHPCRSGEANQASISKAKKPSHPVSASKISKTSNLSASKLKRFPHGLSFPVSSPSFTIPEMPTVLSFDSFFPGSTTSGGGGAPLLGGDTQGAYQAGKSSGRCRSASTSSSALGSPSPPPASMISENSASPSSSLHGNQRSTIHHKASSPVEQQPSYHTHPAMFKDRRGQGVSHANMADSGGKQLLFEHARCSSTGQISASSIKQPSVHQGKANQSSVKRSPITQGNINADSGSVDSNSYVSPSFVTMKSNTSSSSNASWSTGRGRISAGPTPTPHPTLCQDSRPHSSRDNNTKTLSPSERRVPPSTLPKPISSKNRPPGCVIKGSPQSPLPHSRDGTLVKRMPNHNDRKGSRYSNSQSINKDGYRMSRRLASNERVASYLSPAGSQNLTNREMVRRASTSSSRSDSNVFSPLSTFHSSPLVAEPPRCLSPLVADPPTPYESETKIDYYPTDNDTKPDMDALTNPNLSTSSVGLPGTDLSKMTRWEIEQLYYYNAAILEEQTRVTKLLEKRLLELEEESKQTSIHKLTKTEAYVKLLEFVVEPDSVPDVGFDVGGCGQSGGVGFEDVIVGGGPYGPVINSKYDTYKKLLQHTR